MTDIASLMKIYSRRRFACLFFSLVVTMVAAPAFRAIGLNTRPLEVVLALNMLAAVLVTLFRFGTWVALGLLALLVVPRIGYTLLGYPPLLATSQGVGALICLVSVGVMFGYLLREGTVTSERIYAALNAYLLIGIMCGLLFCILEEHWPGSLSLQGAPLARSGESPLWDTIYFSFVTLGTLGYGDIVPVYGPARALAMAEAMFGQMYLVVIVARLVSLYKGQADRKDLGARDDAAGEDKTGSQPSRE